MVFLWGKPKTSLFGCELLCCYLLSCRVLFSAVQFGLVQKHHYSRKKNKGKIYLLPGVPVGFFPRRKEQAEPKTGITVRIK